MYISAKNHEFAPKNSHTLIEARAVLADLTSYTDSLILEAAHQLAEHGESEHERETGLALVALLDVSFPATPQDMMPTFVNMSV